MQPVATVAEMRAADAEALRRVPEAVLVERAGTAVARAAARLLGSPYGRRVVVAAGKGNNGADGRVAARLLSARGARVRVVDPGTAVDPGADLVLDAAFGTGFRGTYDPPPLPEGTPVLAVDIPSGVEGDSGAAAGSPWPARATLSLAALKPGLLQGEGAGLAGAVAVADIGIPATTAAALVEDGDVDRLVPPRPPAAHKWQSAVCLVAGSPGMEGAAALCAAGAARAGAGTVRLAVPGPAGPGGGPRPGPFPLEAVRVLLDGPDWAGRLAPVLDRCRALVLGPGLGRDDETQAEIRALVAGAGVPVVADADALVALAGRPFPRRPADAPLVLTPHDGEYRTLAGRNPGPDRLAAARALSHETGAVVLLKGPLTAVARGEQVLLAAAGSPRLATAGTGDVLSGVIGAFLARGVPAAEAAALAAHVHGRAAGRGPAVGLVAPELPDLVSAWLSEPR